MELLVLININKLMKVVVLALLLVACLSLFATELKEKYSIEVLAEGTEGTKPRKGQQLKMHYEGTLKDGTVFDSSFKRGSPFGVAIGTGQVIPCWDEVGIHLQVGAKVKVTCPAATAYGSRGAGGVIPPNADISFLIERVA